MSGYLFLTFFTKIAAKFCRLLFLFTFAQLFFKPKNMLNVKPNKNVFTSNIFSLKRFGLYLLFSFFIILGNKSEAQTITNKLKAVSLGADSTVLVQQAGEPTKKETVSRWYYGKDQAVLVDGKITDIRLFERSRKIKLRKDQDKKDENVSPVSHLRIGMAGEEALDLAGKPDVSLAGEDWYYTKSHRVELIQGKVEKIDLHIKASMEKLDWIRLNFSDGSLLFMYITIAFVMFGVALGMNLSGFRDIIKNPKFVILGLIAHHILLPAVTFLLVLIIRPTQSVAMGMILVAACPGGNVSNFMTSLAKGNMALSISLTAFTTIMAVFMTPFNFWLWGSLYSKTSELLIPFTIDIWEMLRTVFILLGIPVLLGILFAKKFPALTQKIIKPIKVISIVIFIGYIIAALSANINYFLMYIHLIFLIVLVHNFSAFSSGYGLATLFKVPEPTRRSLTIETGIQNSGLGLVLIFNPLLFNGLGGMAFIAAWWGIWHIIAGLSLGFWWSRRPFKE